MTELKPCPFCGGKAIMNIKEEKRVPSGDYGFRSTIICDDLLYCGGRITRWALEKESAEESAIRAWNYRVGGN